MPELNNIQTLGSERWNLHFCHSEAHLTFILTAQLSLDATMSPSKARMRHSGWRAHNDGKAGATILLRPPLHHNNASLKCRTRLACIT